MHSMPAEERCHGFCAHGRRIRTSSGRGHNIEGGISADVNLRHLLNLRPFAVGPAPTRAPPPLTPPRRRRVPDCFDRFLDLSSPAGQR